jgi:hypothetical protein
VHPCWKKELASDRPDVTDTWGRVWFPASYSYACSHMLEMATGIRSSILHELWHHGMEHILFTTWSISYPTVDIDPIDWYRLSVATYYLLDSRHFDYLKFNKSETCPLDRGGCLDSFIPSPSNLLVFLYIGVSHSI